MDVKGNNMKLGMGILFVLQNMAICFLVVLPLLCGCGKDQDEVSSEGQYEVTCNNKGNAPLVEDTPHNLYSDIYQYVVLIKSEDGIGSGFIGKIDGKTYLYTCLHCVIGKEISFLDSKGQKLVPNAFEICKGRDLVRFTLPRDRDNDGLELIRGQELKVGMEITAYGDSQGVGVITQTKGNVLALGKDLVEIDAGVQHGNSGGPIVDIRGRVIAIVSFGHIDNDMFTKDTRFEKVRRFGVRLTDAEWVRCDLEQFNKELNYLKNADYFLNSCKAFESAINLSSQNKPRIKWNANNNKASDAIGKSFSQSINSMYQEYNEAVEIENRCMQYAKQIDDINVPIAQLETVKRDKSNEVEAQKSRVEEQAKSLPYKGHYNDVMSNEELRLDIEKGILQINESKLEQISSSLSQAYKKRMELIESMAASIEKTYSKFILACCDIPERAYKRILYSLEMLNCEVLTAKREDIRKRIEEEYFAVNKRRADLSSNRQAVIKLIREVKQRYGGTVNIKLESNEDQRQKGEDRGKVNIKLY